MTKILSLFLVFIMLAFAHQSMAQPPRLKQTYNVGIATDVISYVYQDKEKITGYDIDVLEYIAKKLKFQLNYIILSRAEIKKELENGKIDIGLIHALTLKGDENKYIRSIAIDDVTFNLVCGANVKHITSLQDIAGKTVVTIDDSVENQIISDLATKADILSYTLKNSAHIDLEQEVLSNKANCTFLIHPPYFQDFNVYTFSSNLFKDYITKDGVSFLYPRTKHFLLKSLINKQIIKLKLNKIDLKIKAKYNLN